MTLFATPPRDIDSFGFRSWCEKVARFLGTLMNRVDATTGAFTPPSMADSAAPNNSIYYSTTASKLVYKNSGGSVNNLY